MWSSDQKQSHKNLFTQFVSKKDSTVSENDIKHRFQENLHERMTKKHILSDRDVIWSLQKS